MKTLIRIGGADMPLPTQYNIKLVDVDSAASGRGDTGYLTRDRVRADVASIDVGWTMLTDAELHTIQQAIKGTEFDVEYFYWEQGQFNKARMYAGDRNLSLAHSEDKETRWNFNFSLIEY